MRMDGSTGAGWDGGMSIHLKLSGGRLYTIMPIAGAEVSGIDFINHSCRPNCRADAGGLVVETTPDRSGKRRAADDQLS